MADDLSIPAVSEAATNDSGERDIKGRFAPGNRAGGRSKRTREDLYLSLTIENTTPEDWQAVVVRAVEDAKKGDRYAREWLGNYIMGKPTTTVELRGNDLVAFNGLITVLEERGVTFAEIAGTLLAVLTEDTREQE